MREKIEQLNDLYCLLLEYNTKRISYALRSLSKHEDQERYRHKHEICTICIEYLTEKINKIKSEL